MADLAEGQIIVIGTDGIWETKNAQEQMFGKDQIFDIIRQNAKARAEDIVSVVITALNRFRGNLSPEDDVTLMVIKIEDNKLSSRGVFSDNDRHSPAFAGAGSAKTGIQILRHPVYWMPACAGMTNKYSNP